ncbi:MAG: hypothetical protein RSF82_11905 [Angelakisella sp.]
MLSLQRSSIPRSYAHCNQIVTIYHLEGVQYHRTVIHGAYLDFRKNSNVDKLGSKESNSFLLVVPQGADGKTYLAPTEYALRAVKDGCYTLVPNDKILLGEGREVATAAEWREFTPSRVDGLTVAQYIDLKYWQGKLCHLEVGG